MRASLWWKCCECTLDNEMVDYQYFTNHLHRKLKKSLYQLSFDIAQSTQLSALPIFFSDYWTNRQTDAAIHTAAVCMHIGYTTQSRCIKQYWASTHHTLCNYARKVSKMWHFVILWYMYWMANVQHTLPHSHTRTNTVQFICLSSGLRMSLFSALLITTGNIRMSEAKGFKVGVGKWVLQPHPSMGSKGILVDWMQPFTFRLKNGNCVARDRSPKIWTTATSDIWDNENQHLQSLVRVLLVSAAMQNKYVLCPETLNPCIVYNTLSNFHRIPWDYRGAINNSADFQRNFIWFSWDLAITSDTIQGFQCFLWTESHNNQSVSIQAQKTHIQYYSSLLQTAQQLSAMYTSTYLVTRKRVYPYDSYQTLTTLYKE